ncbi:hypothetical protein, partial [Methanosphaera sp.]|uniref:hypothetical protein n=1 Tax=Methanosphaera sp. TaxID=2666342 RepID=UPI0025ECCF20
MAEIKQEGKSHKEIRKEYTFNKLKGLGQEIIEEIEEQKELLKKKKNVPKYLKNMCQSLLKK